MILTIIKKKVFYQKEGLREGLTRFIRKDFPESRREKIAKAKKYCLNINICVFLVLILGVASYATRKLFLVKINFELGFDPMPLLDISAIGLLTCGLYLLFESGDAERKLKLLQGKSLLDISDETEESPSRGDGGF